MVVGVGMRHYSSSAHSTHDKELWRPVDPGLFLNQDQHTNTSVFRGHCLDDRVSFNTQCSTQWDGFRHYPYKNYPKEGEYTYYGGLTTDEARNPDDIRYGIQSELGM